MFQRVPSPTDGCSRFHGNFCLINFEAFGLTIQDCLIFGAVHSVVECNNPSHEYRM